MENPIFDLQGMKALYTYICACTLGTLLACSTLQGQVVINEVMAANQSTVMDDFSEFDDWIEFYYPVGSSPVLFNLAGCYLTDNRNWLTKWQIPDTDLGNTTIVAGNHLLFWIDDDPEQGEAFHAPFKLSADGEKLYLVEPDGETIIDSLWFGDMAPDVSLGRVCDGCEDWQYFSVATPDAPNEVLTPAPHTLFINEVMPTNTGYFDDEEDEFEPWLELYNPSLFNISLGDFTIEVVETGEVFTFLNDDPADTYVADGGHYLLWCDGETEEGHDHATLSLPSEGASLVLRRSDGSVADTYIYPGLADGESYGRQSSGDDLSVVFTQPTPRTWNDLLFITPEELYINEWMPDNETDTADVGGGHPDWFEIYNPNPYPVDLAGYYISDKHENPTKWMVPLDNDSTVVDAWSWKFFWADEDGLQGWNHTSFKLKDSGEELGIYSPDGFTAADEVAWNTITIPNDVSMGRETDGAETFVWFAGTTPEYSNNGQPTNIELLDESDLLQAHPNPVSSVLHLSEKVFGTVLTVDGKWVLDVVEADRIDVRGWTPGWYVLRTTSGMAVRFAVQ